MNALPVILIYLFIASSEIAMLFRKKEKRQIIVYVIIMIIPLILSINISIGTDIPSIASVTKKIIEPLLRKIK